jgi:hypothetical protein
LYKGLPVTQPSGYFAKEFDKAAPSPGYDWGECLVDIWLSAASDKGWVVKTSPKDAKPGALILGFDQTHKVWVGIVRTASDGKIDFETLDDKGKVVQNNADPETIKRDFGLIGYIWPERVMDNK